MPSMTTVALQSTILKTTANLVAQNVAIYKYQSQTAIDWQRVLEFAIFGFIQGHINYWWQQFLEKKFPTLRDGVGWSYWNLGYKLVVDQTVGLLIGNTVFVLCTNIARQRGIIPLLRTVWERVPRIILAAWRLWPAVSLCNFLFVPLQYRAMVAITFGFGWNMFLTFLIHSPS